MYSVIWKRATEPKDPEIWSRFQKINKEGKTLNFRIETISKEYYDEAWDMLVDFIQEEPLHVSAGASKCQKFIDLMYDAAMKVLFPQKLSLICVLDEPNEDQKDTGNKHPSKLVGGNILAIGATEDTLDLTEYMEIEEGALLIQLWMFIKQKFSDIHEKYSLQYYLSSAGLYVHPEYRGLNISKELLLARVPLMKAVGLKITASIFTGGASQAMATKANFKDEGVADYDELEEAMGIKIQKRTTNCCKFLSLTAD